MKTITEFVYGADIAVSDAHGDLMELLRVESMGDVCGHFSEDDMESSLIDWASASLGVKPDQIQVISLTWSSYPTAVI